MDAMAASPDPPDPAQPPAPDVPTADLPAVVTPPPGAGGPAVDPNGVTSDLGRVRADTPTRGLPVDPESSEAHFDRELDDGEPTPTVRPGLPADMDTLTPAPPYEDPVVGMLLGNCRIERKIGQGGMGAAYLATHLALERQVVVKVLPPQYAATAGLQDRFLREARAAAKLNHPNVVHVYDVGAEQGITYYVMEFVDGQSLADLCRDVGRLAPLEATRLTAEAARGLQAAHEAGIVHRDVKPANIIVSASGAAKVLDFGLARDLGKEGISTTGQILGTPHYMAPEQALGEADHRADFYALGITYFRLLTGRLPFEGSSTYNLIQQHRNDRPPSPREHVPDLPESVCLVIERLLEKDPARRFASAAELAEVLERIQAELAGGEPAVIPRAPTGSDRSVLAAAALGLLILTGAVAWPLLSPTRIARDDAPIVRRPTPPSGTPGLSPAPDAEDPAPPADLAPVASADPMEGVPEIVLGEVPGLVRTLPLAVAGTLSGPLPAGAKLMVAGRPAQVEGTAFSAEVGVLRPGENQVAVSLRSGEDVLRRSAWLVEFDATPPELTLLAPAAGARVTLEPGGDRRLEVLVRADGETRPVVTRARVLAEGSVPALLSPRGEEHQGHLALSPRPGKVWVGRVRFQVEATDAAGNEARLEAEVLVIPPDMVLVGDPADAKAFLMDRTEVTSGAFHTFLLATGTKPPNRWRAPTQPRLPASFVSHSLALAYARWRGRRLPTESEWETAAGREPSGSVRRYPWGESESRDLLVNVAFCRGRDAAPHLVGTLADDRSPWGCMDMGGNLWEWVDAGEAGEEQVLKGGCFETHTLTAASVRARHLKPAWQELRQFGFRCARGLEPGEEDDR
jgi:serine/threonine-protein kinase